MGGRIRPSTTISSRSYDTDLEKDDYRIIIDVEAIIQLFSLHRSLINRTETRLFLSPALFSEREQVLVEHGPLTASTFRYESGVYALRIKNERGQLILLPFQGQQVWSATFDGRDLTMRSMFDQPRATRTYLENYGGLLIHCGMTAMGVPTAQDSHPLHGELPNAPYQKAWLTAGEDDNGLFLELGGEYQHTVAFNFNYIASPTTRLHAGRTLFKIGMTVTNLKNTPMEYMYLAHIELPPGRDHSRLVYSAPYDNRARARAHQHPIAHPPAARL